MIKFKHKFLIWFWNYNSLQSLINFINVVDQTYIGKPMKTQKGYVRGGYLKGFKQGGKIVIELHNVKFIKNADLERQINYRKVELFVPRLKRKGWFQWIKK